MSASRQGNGGTLGLRGIELTVFYTESKDGMQRGVDVTVVNDGPPVDAELVCRWHAGETRAALGTIQPGTHDQRVYIPDLRETTEVTFALVVGDQVRDERALTWTPGRHWNVYLVQVSHLDLGFTDLQSNLYREHDSFIDDVVRMCHETADWPEESRFRYVIEQGWPVLHYLEHRSPEAGEELAKLIHEGRVEVNAFLGNETSELCGHEEQIRLVYPSFRLKQRFGVPIRTAELNDVPGVSWGLVSVLAGSGIRYFSPRLPSYFSWGTRQVHPFWDEEEVLPTDISGAFWWEGPDSSRVLLWYGYRMWLWTFEQSVRDLPKHLIQHQERGYPFDIVRFGFESSGRDNAPPDVRLSEIAREWNSRWAYPKLVVATNTMFFERLERESGDQLRVLRGDLPNTDYTVGATSTAKETGINRLTHDVLTAAEKLATCASMVSDYAYPADTLAEAYDCALLYDEHTWGMGHPIGPAQDSCSNQKREFAYRAAALAQDVLLKGANRLADQIHLDDEGYHLVVFNPLAHERTDVVRMPAVTPTPCGRPMYWSYPSPGEDRAPWWVSGAVVGRQIADLPLPLLEGAFELIDLSSGERVPYQVITLDDPLAAREYAAYHYALGVYDPAELKVLAFVAQAVPSMGYKTYRLVPAKEKPSFESSLRMGAHSIENRFYRITLDPESGAIASLFDKELQREWVDDQAPHGFNQLVVRSPREGKEMLASRSSIAQGEAGPVLGSLIVKGEGFGCPRLTQEIILYESVKRIDFFNRVLRDATPLLEVYFAFPFAADEPRFRYESSNSVIEPIRDQLPGSNTDAYAMQHWVSMWDKCGSITWSSLEAPVMEVGGLWPGYVSHAHHAVSPPGYGHAFLRDPSQLEKGHIYSYVMGNNFKTNFQPLQVADVLFRYSMTSYEGEWQQDSAQAFGWGASTPLVPVGVVGEQAGSLPVSATFCQVDQPNILVLTIKGAENGEGLVIRLVETEGRDTVVKVTMPYLEIARAVETNLVEEDRAALDHGLHSVRVAVPANGIATVRCASSQCWPQITRLAYH